METVIDVKALDNYTVMVIFDDNFKATINIKPFITTGISSKLLDNAYFKQVKRNHLTSSMSNAKSQVPYRNTFFASPGAFKSPRLSM